MGALTLTLVEKENKSAWSVLSKRIFVKRKL